MPERTCRVCRTKRQKTELVRWIVTPTGPVADDGSGLGGRGLYSCPGGCTDKLSQRRGKTK